MKLFRYYQRSADGGVIEPFEDDDGPVWSTTEESPVTRQAEIYNHESPNHSQLDPQREEEKSSMEDLLMKLVATEETARELRKESQMMQESKSLQRTMEEFERLMRSTDSPPKEPKVSYTLANSEDSNKDSLLQDKSYPRMEEMEDAESNDWFLDYLEHALQDEGGARKDTLLIDEPSTVKMDSMNQSPIQPEVNLPFFDSDDFDDEFVWQDNTMKETMEEYSDDDCLEGLGILMQEDIDKEAPVEESSTNQSPLQQKVSHPYDKSDDSNSALIFQDETVDEQSDDEFWDDFERILQDGYKEEAPKDETLTVEPSTVDTTTCRFEEVIPEYKTPEILDPVWEASCQKQLDGEQRHIMEYLKDLMQTRLSSQQFGTYSAKRQCKNQKS